MCCKRNGSDDEPELYSIILADRADYFPDSTAPTTIKQALQIVASTNDVKVCIAENMGAYVDVDDFSDFSNIVLQDLSDLKKDKLDKTGDAKDVVVTFAEADTREDISSGDKLSTLFSKIKKFFADLKTVAFTGSYNDLKDRPTASDFGLGSVDDTSDMDKPVSKAQQKALDDHNVSSIAHSDIRDLITGLTTRLNALADSDDTTLDQMSEIVAYIKSNKSLIDSITTSKVNVADIVDNLTSTATNKPLSAKQGKVLNDLIPTKVSQLTNDSGYKTTDTTYSNFVKSGSGAKSGLVPAPSTTSGTTKYLREDGIWQVPPDTNTTYSTATTTTNGLMSAVDKSSLNSLCALTGQPSSVVSYNAQCAVYNFLVERTLGGGYHIYAILQRISLTTTNAWVSIASCTTHPSKAIFGLIKLTDGGVGIEAGLRAAVQITSAGYIQITTPTTFSNATAIIDLWWS